MAHAPDECAVTYEELADLEKEFEDVETEIIRQQVRLTAPLFEKRRQLVAKIPTFWPLVFEQAPPEIDRYVQPSDSALLLSSLVSISVEHFDAASPGGDPRSVSIRFEFAPNDRFLDTSIEKRFWYRRSRSGWAGLVSQPVPIRWRPGRDLTSGMLDLAVRAATEPEARSALRQKIDSTGLGGLSFFAWFGFRGRQVSEEESQAATAAELQRRRGQDTRPSPSPSPSPEDDEDDLEIFPDGDALAVCIADDMWPGAIQYFTQAQEAQDGSSDTDFESDEEALNEEKEDEVDKDADGTHPTKRIRVD